MEICRCRTQTHDNHKDKNCEAPATESDDYCEECHIKAREEALQTTIGVTELPPAEPPPVELPSILLLASGKGCINNFHHGLQTPAGFTGGTHRPSLISTHRPPLHTQ